MYLASSLLYTTVGNDARGKSLIERLRSLQTTEDEMEKTQNCAPCLEDTVDVIADENTATFIVILDEKQDHGQFLQSITYASPNEDELMAIPKSIRVKKHFTADDDDNEAKVSNYNLEDKLNVLKRSSREVIKCMHPLEAHLIITLGSDDVLLVSKKKSIMIIMIINMMKNLFSATFLSLAAAMVTATIQQSKVYSKKIQQVAEIR